MARHIRALQKARHIRALQTARRRRALQTARRKRALETGRAAPASLHGGDGAREHEADVLVVWPSG